jgi:hypothetical protein
MTAVLAADFTRQVRLLDAPLVALTVLPVETANRLLVEWGHRLGPCHRPFTQQAFSLELEDEPISVAISASAVSATVAGYGRGQVVECARLCSRPDAAWATRVMLRLWREVCARRWPDWDVLAAISYSHNAMHRGDLYRFDGWERVRDDCGSTGGGAWSRKRYATDVVHGAKTLWLWRYV